MTESNRGTWQEKWGGYYDGDWKREFVAPILAVLSEEGKIGKIVVDVGSGSWPISELLEDPEKERKIINIDIATPKTKTFIDEQRLRFDAENIQEPNSVDFKKALVQVSEFLGIDPRIETNAQCADTMIFSEILNYVDYRKVLSGFERYLKPGGRFIIINRPGRGYKNLFSENGLKDNNDLYIALKEMGFEIEENVTPNNTEDGKGKSKTMLVMVGRKKQSPV